MKNQKKKAFTLAELLVVVLIVGVLASVAVPKMKSVIETRRTTEAEDIMTAVRTEQEKRCVLGKQYLMDSSKVDALANASNSTNYSYALDTTGIVAQSKGKDYNLQIRSYKTGEICCQGEYCASLNKNYPSCDSVVVLEDECAGVAPSEPTPEPEIPEPTPTPENPCDPTSKPEDFYVPCGPCGKQLMVYSCQEVNAGVYAWIPSGQGCELTPADSPNECTPGASESQSCGANGTKTRTCSNTCAWGEWSSCEGDCAPTHNGQATYTESCTDGKVGAVVYNWNASTCSYTKTENCSCPNGTRADGTCKQAVTKTTYTMTNTGTSPIPACSTSSCSSLSYTECQNFRLNNGNTITSVAGGVFCEECNANRYNYSCISSFYTSTSGSTRYCNYVVSRCDKKTTTTWE